MKLCIDTDCGPIINMFWHDKLICISENGVIRAVHLQQPYYD